MDGRNSREWLAPLTGVLFVILVVVSFVLQGEPPGADEPAAEIVEHYTDDKDAIQIGAFIGAVAGTFFVFFFAYVRKVLRAAEGASGALSIVALIGAAIIAVAAAIDSTISFALADRADDISPESVQALQALWDNDFVPFALGAQLLWLAVGLSIVRHGALPKWLGWVALVFGVASLTPLGFFAFLAGLVWVLIVSVMLAMQARREPAPPAAA